MSDDLLPSSSNDPRWAMTWSELGQGAPTLAGLARIASEALAAGGHRNKTENLSPEARCILFAAKNRGIIEVKGANRAFDAPGRMLAVHVEAEVDHIFVFRIRENPAATIRFLAGFRELCAAGLAMHHIYTEFSLTREGLAAAAEVTEAEAAPWLSMAQEMGALD